ncbi:sulfate permease [Thozetella sp. PMI_491]|nr:sulfate permease [Thozetella sp. PMI_491]
MKFTEKVKEHVRTDETISRTAATFRSSLKKLPSATVQYAVEKVPIVQWLPSYDPRWILSDLIAGMTIGVMMIPQALAYAKIATIPGEFGLYSSWLPAALYVFMGTSKDLSTGPTSILGLLTAEAVLDLSKEGFAPQDIASAMAFVVGVYSLLIGLLKLGFLLEYISVPVLSGFLSAAALTILLGQVGSLVGLSNVPSGTAPIISNVLSRIPEFKPLTLAIGFGGIVVLYALEFVGKRWGKKNAAIKFASSSRAVIVLLIFTSISYVLNKDRPATPLWELSKVTANGLIAPKVPSMDLIQKVATKSVAPLVAAALEHLAIGRAFGRKNGYSIDTSQELCYLGVTNTINSLFGAMSVGGAMSRTAVNSECGVKSPLNGLFTAGFVLLTLYKLAGALFWIPKATLSAIIIMAVIHVIGPVSLFYKFWRQSFADFVASMLSFWITLFVGTETGIAVAVAFSVGYIMLRSAFAKAEIYTNLQPRPSKPTQRSSTFDEKFESIVPIGTMVVQFDNAIFFPNANRVKSCVLEAVQVMYPSSGSTDLAAAPEERSWSVASEKRIEMLRRTKGIRVAETPLRVIVWDLGHVPFVDVTGVTALGELKEEIKKYAGKEIDIRFTNLVNGVRARFERAGWKLVDDGDARFRQADADVVYASPSDAIWDQDDFYGAEAADNKNYI